ncbi:hypothetical protein LTR84_010210 [Exophiala bonariae]|uniref:SWIM-type domain-containing protein n=1 Tax=Exophiala bonariae TaxID=1690606 RepID=A0AAV9MWV7_9EURO|nr:hypothetical protein LTR84_010210 [Exophiala bonariae]
MNYNYVPKPESSVLDHLLSALGTLQPFSPLMSGRPAIDELLLGPQRSGMHSPSLNSGRLHHLPVDDTEKARSVFLTLHVLFPHHLLPALDLLDRGLVTRLMPKSSGSAASQSQGPSWEVYYVQSSSALTSKPSPRRKKPSVLAIFYEVRLDSWNCSCPAFSVDAFQGLMDQYENDEEPVDGSTVLPTTEQLGQLDFNPPREDETEEAGGRVGGTTTFAIPGGTPVCKHILAATLAKVAPNLFSTGVTETTASREQLAGWGAGWGEFGYG